MAVANDHPVLILVGDKSFYILTIGSLLGTDAILKGCQATPNTVIYGILKLRGIMGLMLFDPGRMNSNHIALQDTLKRWDLINCYFQALTSPSLCIPCVTAGGLCRMHGGTQF